MNLASLKKTVLLASWLPMLSINSIADPSVKRITEKETVYEIEIVNDEPFYMGALPYELKIGEQRFHRSRHPESGDLTTIIFEVDRTVIQALGNDKDIQLGYGRVITQIPEERDNLKLGAKSQSRPSRQWFLGDFTITPQQ